MAKGRNARRGALLSFFNQFVILALGLLLPRLTIVSYGSETNGLINTVTQIFTYVALLEAGIGNAAVNALYRPIVKDDIEQICDVFSAAQKYFRKVSVLYAVCVVVLSVVYPFAVKSDLGYTTIALVVLLQGMSGVVTFFFSAAYRQLLTADGQYHIISTIHLIVYVLSSFGKIILMSLGYDVISLMALTFLINCLQVLLFIVVMRRKYPYLRTVRSPNMSALAERKAFVVHEVSSAIFSSTDALVLSTFCNLKVTSVYTVYNMVFSSLSTLLNAVNNSVNYILGHVWAEKDERKYCQVHDVYESLYMSAVFSTFTVAYILILPFVSMYTAGVTDIKYVDIYLPILFVLVQLLSCVRATASRLITISGHAEATQKRSMAEAAINLISSVILVNFIGIYGVLLGTILALLYRSNDIIIYANRRILNRSPWKTYKKMVANFAVFGLVVLVMTMARDFVMTECNTYLWFVVFGLLLLPVSVLIYALVALATEKEVLAIMKRKMNWRA